MDYFLNHILIVIMHDDYRIGNTYIFEFSFGFVETLFFS